MKNTFLITIMIMMVGHMVMADSLVFSKVKTNGSGCPAGTTSSVLSPDSKALSILFDDLYLELPQYDGDNENDEASDDHRFLMSRFDKTTAHKVCNITADVKVPVGQKVDSIEVEVDYRGSGYLDNGAKALFHSKFIKWNNFKKGKEHRAKNTIARRVWRTGSFDDDWTITGKKEIRINGSCSSSTGTGDTLTFTLKNIMKAQIPAHQDEITSFLSLDSADIAGNMKLIVNTSSCSSSNIVQAPSSPNRDRARRRSSRGQMRRGKICPNGSFYDARLRRCRSTASTRGFPRRR